MGTLKWGDSKSRLSEMGLLRNLQGTSSYSPPGPHRHHPASCAGGSPLPSFPWGGGGPSFTWGGSGEPEWGHSTLFSLPCFLCKDFFVCESSVSGAEQCRALFSSLALGLLRSSLIPVPGTLWPHQLLACLPGSPSLAGLGHSGRPLRRHLLNSKCGWEQSWLGRVRAELWAESRVALPGWLSVFVSFLAHGGPGGSRGRGTA